MSSTLESWLYDVGIFVQKYHIIIRILLQIIYIYILNYQLYYRLVCKKALCIYEGDQGGYPQEWDSRKNMMGEGESES